ncbi:MOB kinase activator 3A isoform X4 [Anguilla rostrata]|uniref:MOB kinase activator 3A isoform X4 n=1 Tax=Anguilla rostrata TaxID=7938 RepID=UPI0030CDF8C1
MSLVLKQVFNKDRTFRPVRKFERGTQHFDMYEVLKASSLDVMLDFKQAVQLPQGKGLHDWVAVHVVHFFNRINLIYGNISDSCTEQSCPVMSGGPEYEYRWQDDGKYKKPTALPAPKYMSLLMDWIEVQMNNKDIFPTNVGAPFPKTFMQVAKKILSRLFRVFVHVYYHHFDRVSQMGAEVHVDSCYMRFYYFVTEFNLMDHKQLEPLVFSKDQKFWPRWKFNRGMQRFELYRVLQASLNAGLDLKQAVQLPHGEGLHDWVTVHVVDFFNRINQIYGTISDSCTEQSCPVMSGGPKYEYHWQDDGKYKRPTALPAPKYMSLLMDWIEVQMNNKDIFPANVGTPFPKTFMQVAKKILSRLFRVFAHVYFHHFDRVSQMGAEAHVKTYYKSFYYFVTEFNLMDHKQLEPLVFNKDRTFRPKWKFEPRTPHLVLHKKAQASLDTMLYFKQMVQLPHGEGLHNWVAVHVVDFFNGINLIYGTISDSCTEQSCPVMSGGPKYEYRWQDDGKYKRPTALPAPKYMSLLMDWIEVQINNKDIFPINAGTPFPKTFMQVAKKILSRLFRVFVHVYFHHFDHVSQMGAEAHVNTYYKYFYYFVTEFNLMDHKQLEPLKEMTSRMCHREMDPPPPIPKLHIPPPLQEHSRTTRERRLKQETQSERINFCKRVIIFFSRRAF